MITTTTETPVALEADAVALLRSAFGLAAIETAPGAPRRSDFTKADVSTLASRWAAWAASPGSVRTAGRLEDQCQRIASELGTTGTAIRLWCLRNLAVLEEIERQARA
jgi:hypothetical protein